MISTNAADEALSRFRKICLGLPETAETNSWGHPNFKAGKRTFTAFEWLKDRPSFAFNVGTDGVAQLLLGEGPFFATPYGRGKWISIWADDTIDWQLVEELIIQSYRQVALKRMIAALGNDYGV